MLAEGVPWERNSSLPYFPSPVIIPDFRVQLSNRIYKDNFGFVCVCRRELIISGEGLYIFSGFCCCCPENGSFSCLHVDQLNVGLKTFLSSSAQDTGYLVHTEESNADCLAQMAFC